MSMSENDDLLSARDAARLLGISLDTLRRWDAAGRIPTQRDARNRRLVARRDVERLMDARRVGRAHTTRSARNRISCVVTSVQLDGLLARIDLDAADPAHLTAIITREAAEELGLHPGAHVNAVVKATSMMVEAT